MENKYLVIGISIIVCFILLMFFVNVMENRQMYYGTNASGYNNNNGGSVSHSRFYYVTHPWTLFNNNNGSAYGQMNAQQQSIGMGAQNAQQPIGMGAQNAQMNTAGGRRASFQRNSYKHNVSQKQTSVSI